MTTMAVNGSHFPYMPLFVDDWLTSEAVDAFTLEQRAAYLQLLLRQWKAPDGVLPTDERELARMSGLGRRWQKLGRPIIARCFVKRGDRYVNPRCRAEWEHARTRSKQAAAAARARWEQ